MNYGMIQAHRQQDDFISLSLIFQNKESKIKIKVTVISRTARPADFMRTYVSGELN
jgi:hypothetical protein